MERLVIKGTNNTPNIQLDLTQGMELGGESRPENTKEFYDPVIDWFKELELHLKNQSTGNSFSFNQSLTFKWYYFNSSSARAIFEVLGIVKNINAIDGVSLPVEWHYFEEDLDVYEIGKELEELVGSEFRFIKSDNDGNFF